MHIPVIDRSSVKQDTSGDPIIKIQFEHAIKASEKCGFARTRRPDDGQDLTALGLEVSLSGRSVQVVLRDDSTYDSILGAVAELDLPLHSLDQCRHRVAELFTREASNVD